MRGEDRDAIPIVRVAPEYPPRAIARGIEGWVQVQFTVTTIGTVKDAIVVAAEPRKTFDDAALKAIARWRYNPKVENGVAVERVGCKRSSASSSSNRRSRPGRRATRAAGDSPTIEAPLRQHVHGRRAPP